MSHHGAFILELHQSNITIRISLHFSTFKDDLCWWLWWGCLCLTVSFNRFSIRVRICVYTWPIRRYMSFRLFTSFGNQLISMMIHSDVQFTNHNHELTFFRCSCESRGGRRQECWEVFPCPPLLRWHVPHAVYRYNRRRFPVWWPSFNYFFSYSE